MSARLPYAKADWILEGGAVDGDGSGLFVTTEQCLLNPNRNPGLSREEIEQRLARRPRRDRVVWLGEGLLNDHTDGHVDNLARFVGSGGVALPGARGATTPMPRSMPMPRTRIDERRALDLVRLPSPGQVEADGESCRPAYMNFLSATPRWWCRIYGSPERRGRGRRRRRRSSRTRRSGPSRRPHPDRRRQLPLHLPADPGLRRPMTKITVAALQLALRRRHARPTSRP